MFISVIGFLSFSIVGNDNTILIHTLPYYRSRIVIKVNPFLIPSIVVFLNLKRSDGHETMRVISYNNNYVLLVINFIYANVYLFHMELS